MSAAKHNVVVQAWDIEGSSLQAGIDPDGDCPGPDADSDSNPGSNAWLPVPPTTAFTYTDIDQMTGWRAALPARESAETVLRPLSPWSQNQASPSWTASQPSSASVAPRPIRTLSGGSSLGAVNTATNLKYDLYFYLTNPTAIQALEFDSNQADGKHHFIFGTQCSVGHKADGTSGVMQMAMAEHRRCMHSSGCIHVAPSDLGI